MSAQVVLLGTGTPNAEPERFGAALAVLAPGGLLVTASCSARVSAEQFTDAVKEKIVLRGVNFDFDQAEIRGDAAVILDEAVEIVFDQVVLRHGDQPRTASTPAAKPDHSVRSCDNRLPPASVNL